MVFYDFEVFKHNWLVVIMDMTAQKETVIVNNADELEAFHAAHVNDIWIGFNSRHYDQWILKGILCGFDPKRINDFIIVRDNAGWKFSSLLNRVPLCNYDVMSNIDRGLKFFEGSMGNSIRETSVPFDIDRPLTQAEIDETVKYCRHDVENTVQVFLERKDDFEAQMGLLRIACGDGGLDLSLISKTKPQLSALILGAVRKDYNDEFDIDFPHTLKLTKYTAVLDWYKNPENRKYKVNPNNPKSKNHQLEIMVAGVPHVFGWGGLHGAKPKYSGEGYYINMDVASLYPSLMIRYGLLSRSVKDPAKFEQIYHQRLQYKAEGNPLQLPLKLVLNSTYGVMKDKNNALYDPLQANRVCVYGQLLLLDLIERLEPHCEIIQSNTDGVLIKLRQYGDYELIDDICFEWEQRTMLQLEFQEFVRVWQGDVNNYVIIAADGHYKRKGAYVKELSNLDYDLPIVNRALVDYMVHGVAIERTIRGCDDLKEFQLISKISGKYTGIFHGDKPIKEKCVRIFASKNESDAGMTKVSAKTGRPAKLTNSPEHCFVYNDDVNGVKCPPQLDKEWYVAMAKKRLEKFGG